MTVLWFVLEALTYAGTYFVMRLAMGAVGWMARHSFREEIAYSFAFGTISVLLNRWRQLVKQKNGWGKSGKA